MQSCIGCKWHSPVPPNPICSACSATISPKRFLFVFAFNSNLYNSFRLYGCANREFTFRTKKGWIFKTGPRQSDGYKRRWFTLDNRKLMYHDDRLDAYPKGEIFLGNQLDGYSVRIGVSATSAKNQGYPFTLFTPERIYNLSCATEQERDEWIRTIQHVLERPLTPQDSSGELPCDDDDDYYNFFYSLIFIGPNYILPKPQFVPTNSFTSCFPFSPPIPLTLFCVPSSPIDATSSANLFFFSCSITFVRPNH